MYQSDMAEDMKWWLTMYQPDMATLLYSSCLLSKISYPNKYSNVLLAEWP